MAEHLLPHRRQRAPITGLVLGVAAVVAAVVGIYFSRADLGDKLDVAERQVAELRRELDCRGDLAAQVDVARVDNDIAYDNYVLALGTRDEAAIPKAREDIVKARDALAAVRDKRDKTAETCR